MKEVTVLSHILAAYIADKCINAALINPGRHTPTVALAAAALGVEPSAIVKSVVLEAGDCVAVVIVPGDLRVDLKKAASVLQVSCLRLARPEVVKFSTGFEPGGVPPVGHLRRLPVVVDPRVLAKNFVFGGGGDERHMLRISPTDIVRLTAAVVADVSCRQAPSRE
jgi:Cys-tRNA(Pro) deacylase